MKVHRKMRAGGTVIFLLGTALLSSCGGNEGDAQWRFNGHTHDEQRFSPLDAISAGNVNQLGVAWFHDFAETRGQQATPIVADGILYVSTAWSNVYAMDAATGKLKWSYDAQVPHAKLSRSCCDAVNRGVALADGKVFVGTLDGRLIALDAHSGKQLWATMTVDPNKPYTITGAPRVVKGKVLIGNGGADFGVRGYVSAYDAGSGKLAWRFYTVPNAEGKADGQISDEPLKRLAASTWSDGAWKKTGGGGTVWDAMAYDPEADLVFIGVGNGGPHNHKIRSGGKGDNLFLSSILALRPDTGEYVWHYQETPGESWDYTATQSMILADLEIDGRPRKVLFHAPKNGFFYVIDRLTGKPLSAKPYVEVNWASGVDLKTGRPMETPGARTDGFRQTPGPLGGHGPQPMSYNPALQLVFIPTQHTSFTYTEDKSYQYRPNRRNLGNDITSLKFDASDPKLINKVAASQWGELVAWDPVHRKARWSVRQRYWLNGGTLATGGNLVFQGSPDGGFRAYAADTGRQLWQYQSQNGIIAAPISYALDGVQYIAIMTGYGGPSATSGIGLPVYPQMPGRLLVFKLGGAAKPGVIARPTAGPIAVDGFSSSGDVANGYARYMEQCVTCHGFGVAAGFNADLRRSPTLGSAELWKNVVIGGALSNTGMSSFGDIYTSKDAEDIRAYVLTEARKWQKRQTASSD